MYIFLGLHITAATIVNSTRAELSAHTDEYSAFTDMSRTEFIVQIDLYFNRKI